MSAQPVNALDFSQYAGLRAAAKQNDPAALKQAAQQFEALFTQMMLKSMRDALPGDSTLGAQGDFYTSLYDQQLSTTLASGKGMGLADLLVKQLAQSSNAAGAASASVNSASSIAAYSKTAKRAAIDEPGEVGASEWTPGDADSFLDAIRPHAEKAAQALGVPTRAIMAQAVLETGWGRRIPRDTDAGRRSICSASKPVRTGAARPSRPAPRNTSMVSSEKSPRASAPTARCPKPSTITSSS